MLYLPLCTGPAINVQPSDVNAAEAGGTATFTVEASGEGLSYQWFGPGGDALTDVDGHINGSNSPTLQIINVESGDAGDYTVVVTNNAGSVDSDAATLSIGELCTFTIQVYYLFVWRFQVKVP